MKSNLDLNSLMEELVEFQKKWKLLNLAVKMM